MPLRLLPLGGLGEVGKNCLALESGGSILVVDCGVSFAREKLGTDVVYPDFRAIERLPGNVVGLFVTHGHEDHIGAIPYFLRRFDVPVFLPAHARELLREREEEHEVLENARFSVVAKGERVTIGPFEVEPIRVTHSTVDCTALAIRTLGMTIVHTGDFKIDREPTDGEDFDEARFRELGDEGVSLLFSDSTNVDVEGLTPSERSTKEALLEAVRETKGAAVVGLFASNVHRLRIAFEIAKETGRRVALLGRGMRTHASVARRTGHLPWPDALILPESAVRDTPRSEILAVATGSQGEVRAALSSLARGEHPVLALAPSDRVIFSSRVIPGNELEVVALTDQLLRSGVEVVSRIHDRRLHVSGHAHREDQRTMLALVRPKVFVPVHGTLHHLLRHKALAMEMGVAESHVLENGDLAEVGPDGESPALSIVTRLKVPVAYASYGKEVAGEARLTRSRLAEGGIVIGAISEEGHLLRVSQRGAFSEAAEPRAMGELTAHLEAALSAFSYRDEDPALRRKAIEEAAVRAVRSFAKKRWKTRPEVEIVVLDRESLGSPPPLGRT